MRVFCPRTENSKLWQVNLLTQSVRAKFTELVNTVVFSCDWSQHLPAFPWLWRNMKVKKINYWAPLQKKPKNKTKQCHLYIQYTGTPEIVLLLVRELFSVCMSLLCADGGAGSTHLLLQLGLCAVLLQTGCHYYFLAARPLWSQMSECDSDTHPLTYMCAHQPIRHTGWLGVSQ